MLSTITAVLGHIMYRLSSVVLLHCVVVKHTHCCSCRDADLRRQALPCMFLAHHMLESVEIYSYYWLLLLQASMAVAEQEALEDNMSTIQERHYMNVAAECKVSNQTLQHFLEEIEQESQPNEISEAAGVVDTFELLPCSSIHRLGLGVHDLTLLHV